MAASASKPNNKLGKPVLVGPYRSRARNRIYRVGIELEGGWDKLPEGVSGLERDGSIRFDSLAERVPAYVGELPSPGNGMAVQLWPQWLKNCYPHAVNPTGGMHVHMQPVTALTYQRLMDPRYPATVVQAFKEWAKKEGFPAGHHFWERLAGKSRYCQHLYYPDDQIKKQDKDFNQERQGHRYTVIHYCYARYGTVECRLLPMMQEHKQAERAVRELIEVTNAFLLATAKREHKFIEKVMAPGDGAVIEEVRLRV